MSAAEVCQSAAGNLEVLCVGDRALLCRPCVDCGLRTGRYCDFCHFCLQAIAAVQASQFQFPSDSQWAADGWTAGGWSSWTGGNGWEEAWEDHGRRIDSDPMKKRMELLEERMSSLEKEVAAW